MNKFITAMIVILVGATIVMQLTTTPKPIKPSFSNYPNLNSLQRDTTMNY